MGKIYIAGGGGADVSETTATSGDVLNGQKFVNADGDLTTGTLTLSGDASAENVLKDKKFYSTNAKSKQTGTMPNNGSPSLSVERNKSIKLDAGYYSGGNVVGPTMKDYADGKALNTFTPSASKLEYTVPAGYHDGRGKVYCNGINVAVLNNSGTYDNVSLEAKYIPKNVKIAGIAGTFEGYVASATQFFNKTDNKAQFEYRCDPLGLADLISSSAIGATVNTGEMTVPYNNGGVYMCSANTFNFSGYRHIKITGKGLTYYNSGGGGIASYPSRVYIGLVSNNKSAPHAYGSYICQYIGRHRYEEDDSSGERNYERAYNTSSSTEKIYNAVNVTDTELIFDIDFNATKYLALSFQPYNKECKIYTIEVY